MPQLIFTNEIPQADEDYNGFYIGETNFIEQLSDQALGSAVALDLPNSDFLSAFMHILRRDPDFVCFSGKFLSTALVSNNPTFSDRVGYALDTGHDVIVSYPGESSREITFSARLLGFPLWEEIKFKFLPRGAY